MSLCQDIGFSFKNPVSKIRDLEHPAMIGASPLVAPSPLEEAEMLPKVVISLSRSRHNTVQSSNEYANTSSVATALCHHGGWCN